MQVSPRAISRAAVNVTNGESAAVCALDASAGECEGSAAARTPEDTLLPGHPWERRGLVQELHEGACAIAERRMPHEPVGTAQHRSGEVEHGPMAGDGEGRRGIYTGSIGPNLWRESLILSAEGALRGSHNQNTTALLQPASTSANRRRGVF